MTDSKKDTILIIEDSKATGILLTEFLKNLGYENIITSEDGKGGITTYKELQDAGKNAIILLDYNLPDMDARSIMTQLLDISPNVKVILETATDKSDEGVTELLRQGLYQYISKPIRFEVLKEVFSTLEKEKQFFEKEDAMIQILKKAEEEKYSAINFLLKSHKQISQAMIEEYAEAKGEDIVKYLDDLESKGKIVKLEEKKEIACRQCGSIKITQTFFCPSCKENDFKITKLIEHFKCGNFSPEASYEDDKCPKCKKEIKAVGVDYRIMPNQYVCNSCGEIFQEIASRFLCLKCENKFPIEEVRWITSPFYKAIKM